MAEYFYYLFIGGGTLTLLGLWLLHKARQADQENYIIEKATPLPLSLVTVRDDVWLDGVAECDAPLYGPHFGTSCLHYYYTLEERVTETYTDSDGRTRTRTTWKTRDTRQDSALFRLRDGELTIEIDGHQADFRNLESESVTLGSWRHTLNYYPFPGDVHAVGSVGEKKERLEPYANIPLIVTTLGRQEFVEYLESSESWMRGGGFFFLFAGVVALFYAIYDLQSIPGPTGGRFHWMTLLYSLGTSLAIMLPIWFIYMYNTFVTYGIRVENAWKQVDVDLKMRYELIPNLVSVVKGYMKHESSLLEDLTHLRTKAVSLDREGRIDLEENMVQSVSQVIARSEKYPDLKAQGPALNLMKQLKALEEKIAHGRTIYNETVREYNENVLAMPRGLIAMTFGFHTKKFFEATEEEKKAVRVNLTASE